MSAILTKLVVLLLLGCCSIQTQPQSLQGWRCRGRNFDKEKCCTVDAPCEEGEGDCDDDSDCAGELCCGNNNCKSFANFYHQKDDCCMKPSTNFNARNSTSLNKKCRGRNIDTGRCCTKENPCNEGEGDCDVDNECSDDLICGNNNCKQFGSFFHEKDDCCVRQNPITISVPNPRKSTPLLLEPPPGQRCSGRNYQGRRCCTPDNPCNEGEGDCDGPGDGGQHDGNAGCKGDLVCGSNNCKQFGAYFHEKDDCCEKPDLVKEEPELVLMPGVPLLPELVLMPGVPLLPPAEQRCSGRNYQGRRCCTPDTPCGEGEGDCDGPGDGGEHDGHQGCKGELVCGSNNCLKFGLYFHEKDDCCEKSQEKNLIENKQSLFQNNDAKLLSKKDRLRIMNEIKQIPDNWTGHLPPYGSDKDEGLENWAWN